MSFLIRVQLPDEPGSLGVLAEAFGRVGANIRSVDIVDVSTERLVTDDIVVELPGNAMADALITAASSVEGVSVDSIRPFSGTVDRRGQIEMLAALAARTGGRTQAIQSFVDALPASMTASWALVAEVGKGQVQRFVASQAAPEDDGTTPSSINVESARVLRPDSDTWVPESWTLMDTALAAAPLSHTGLTLIVGRHGGPDFLPSEVEHVGQLAMIVGKLL